MCCGRCRGERQAAYSVLDFDPHRLRLDFTQSVRVQLLELLQVNEVVGHFPCREVIEEAQHAPEQHAVLASAHLLGHKDTSMRSLHGLPLLVKRGKIADIEGEYGSTFVG